MPQQLRSLPIDPLLPRVCEMLRQHRCLVLQAPPGAGKTTRIPPALQEAGLCSDRIIVMIEPRRLAARTAAARIAQEQGQNVGQNVGYWVRWDRRIGPESRIWVVTEGIFLGMLQQDPFLENIGVVIFDEFHERSLQADLSLAMARKVQQEANPDLRLLVMSATLRVEPIAAYLGRIPVLVSEGQTAPVSVQYLDTADTRSIPERTVAGIRRILGETAGDILAFLPGMGEIQRTSQLLQDWAVQHDVVLFPLHGSMTPEEQDRALAPCDKTKIILATNVAETSLTIEGIRAVVDAGYARVLRHDPGTGLNRLELEPISQASATQRAGRAGRTAPGICLRLWTVQQQHKLCSEESPEIHRVDLSGAVLELLHWGENDIASFPWLESPQPAAIAQGVALLKSLGAVHGHDQITPLGHRMASLPLHPRLSRLMLAAIDLSCLPEAAMLAALLSERDPFHPPALPSSGSSVEEDSLDIMDRLHALFASNKRSAKTPLSHRLKTSAAADILRIQKQLLALGQDLAANESSTVNEKNSKSPTLASPRRPEGARFDQRIEKGNTIPTSAISDDVENRLRRALLTAYPDRVAKRRTPQSSQAVLVGGKGVQLLRSQLPLDGEWFLCIDMSTGNPGQFADWLVRLASPIDPAWLPSDEISEDTEVFFDPDKQRVSALHRKRWYNLILSERMADIPNNDALSACLVEAADSRLEQALPLQDPQVLEFLARIRSLARWLPESSIPCFLPDELRSMLPMLCAGKRSFADLRDLPLIRILVDSLPYATRQLLEQEAPERITVPSGSQIRLQYQEDGPPILAVRIQEIFGWTETPRVARGRVPILLHLLAPNMRPQQVTQDLANFWKQTYREVRKELRQRYPKHAWPEDPTSALPERRPQRHHRSA